jgi:hypothetical protein
VAKSKSSTKSAPPRNRSAEARAKGRTLIAVEVGPACVERIATASEGLPEILGVSRVSKAQALEWLVLHGFAEFQKKHPMGA